MEHSAGPIDSENVPGSSRLLDAFLETARVGLVVTDHESRVVLANTAAATLLGLPVEQLLGRPAVELVYPEDQQAFGRLLAGLRDGRAEQAELQTRSRGVNGKRPTLHLSAVAAFERDGELTNILVTVCERAVGALHDQQIHDRLVASNILGIAVATERGIEDANDEMLRLVGTTRERFDAYGFDWHEATDPEDLRKDTHGMREMLERGSCVPFEKSFVHADGTRIPVLVAGALLDHAPLRWVAFALDLSERKAAERERDLLLEEARASRADAEAALRSRDSLLARITHDLRTPVGANYGYASLLEEGLPDPLTPGQRTIVQRMLANQRHMMALIDQLLEFAHSTSEAEITLTRVPVADLLRDIQSLIEPQLQAAGLRYECRPCEPELMVRADRTRTLQILSNLVQNAVKFTPHGGSITVTAITADSDAVISVQDTGVGIDREHLERIFEPFVQVDSAAAPSSSVHPRGFGLGLAIGRELARRMGGELMAESVVGVGSTFVLRLPLAQATATSTATAS